MISSIIWKLRSLLQLLWVRTAFFALLALIVALLAPFTTVLPFNLAFKIEQEALQQLLSILTNSMLAVTTFSLSIMVSAHLAADGSATPRAHRLLRQDGRTQSVIATFIGAFIYALTLTVLMSVDLISEGEVAIVYIVTVGVILLVVIAILRWVAHLAGLGSVESTIDRVEESARSSIMKCVNNPYHRAHIYHDASDIPRAAGIVHGKTFGYIQNIDTDALGEISEERAISIWLAVTPGDTVGDGDALAYVDGEALDEQSERQIRASIHVGTHRDYVQDPIYALTVLCEIGERALSPGINDPRTAIGVVTRLTRLVDMIDDTHESEEPEATAVYIRPIDLHDLMRCSFDPIARDGSGFVEVQLVLQGAYQRLARHRNEAISEAAKQLSGRALTYADAGILLADDLDRIRQVAPATEMAERKGDDPSPDMDRAP